MQAHKAGGITLAAADRTQTGGLYRLGIGIENGFVHGAFHLSVVFSIVEKFALSVRRTAFGRIRRTKVLY